MANGDHSPPHHPHEPPPQSIAELWIHLRAEQKATTEHRHDLKNSMQNIHTRLTHIEASFDKQYVRKDYFEAVFNPVRNIVYGLVVVVTGAVLTALINLVVN